MATTPNDANPRFQAKPADAPVARDDDAPRAASVGEHVFIWLAWALAAAFWGAALTTMTGILRSTSETASRIAAPSLSGGSAAYLILVVTVFVALAAALVYASLRSANSSTGGGEPASAAVYATIYRHGAEKMTDGSYPRARGDGEFL